MAFTNIPNSDIDVGSPITTGLMTALRDNDDFLFAERAGFVLVEKKLVTADVQDLTFSGLDGDTDEVYRLIGRIVSGAGAGTAFTLRPNNISTNQDSIIVEHRPSLIGSTQANLHLVTHTLSSDVVTFNATFWAKKNPNSVAVNRALLSEWAALGTTLPQAAGKSVGLWDETTTNVTSLVVHGPTASDIKNGSTVALYKLRQS